MNNAPEIDDDDLLFSVEIGRNEDGDLVIVAMGELTDDDEREGVLKALRAIADNIEETHDHGPTH